MPEGDFSGEDEVPAGEDEVPAGEDEVPAGDSAGEVTPEGESAGEAPPPGASVFGWQADRVATKPSRSVAIIFDLTLNSSHSFNFGFYPILTTQVDFMPPSRIKTFWRIFYYYGQI